MDGQPKVMSRSYDVLGRPWETSNWGAGAPAPEKINFDGTVVHHRYDELSRLSGSTWVTAGGVESFDIEVKRDDHGRIVQTLYPDIGGGQRLTIEQVFDGAYVKSVVDATDPAHRKSLWTITARKADGALRAGQFGDAIATYEAQYDAMGQPRRIQAHRGAGDFLMDLEVTPDANGNVKRREDHAAHRVETFAYDELYRLRHWSNTSGGVTIARSRGSASLGRNRNRNREEERRMTESAPMTPHDAPARPSSPRSRGRA